MPGIFSDEIGIIPARAGFTLRRPAAPRVSRDHPRSRGVYMESAVFLMPSRGSSPLARGLPSALWDMRRRQMDHPRSRGVYSGLTAMRSPSPGSSPLARGLLDGAIDIDARPGIIPARAGFTSRGIAGKDAATDHPRSRGVYRNFWVSSRTSTGSSPLARGLRVHRRGAGCGVRIIPARAGFTSGFRVHSGRLADHPRSRGVYRAARFGETVGSGSSPLARGLLHCADGQFSQRRIIPARAGFTRRRPRRGARYPDHPRSRGVYGSSRWTPQRIPGSSPLARGLLGELGEDPQLVGIIPARAGFTWPRGR